jgi:hypothetical protein
MLDDRLSSHIKHQGYLNMFNGINITQIHNYIKINCQSIVKKGLQEIPDQLDAHYPHDQQPPNPLSPNRSKLGQEIQCCNQFLE